LRHDCGRTAKAFAKLQLAYGQGIRVTMGEPSSSIIVRSEHQYTQDVSHRFAIRQHIHELRRASGEAPQNGPAIPCEMIEPGHDFGEYLGFIDIRPKADIAPIAMGVLVPPRWLREDPFAFIITGLYGYLFGGCGFPASIYNMHEENLSGARCAQACIIMVLAALSDRGAKIAGSFEISVMAGEDRHFNPQAFGSQAARDKNCIRRLVPPGPTAFFIIEALQVAQVRQLLCDRDLGVSPFSITFDPDVTARTATRVLEAFILARFPVIVAVHTSIWWGPKYSEGHGVVIVGIRRCSHDKDALTFVAHDPAYKPFGERSAEVTFAAALRYKRENKIQCVAVADAGITVSLLSCIRILRQNDPFFRSLQGTVTIGQSADRHLRQAEGGEREEDTPGRDFRIRLCSHNEVLYKLWDNSYTLVSCRKLQEQLSARLPDGRYWCIGGYEAGKLKRVWMFDANPVPSSPSWRELDLAARPAVLRTHSASSPMRPPPSHVKVIETPRAYGPWPRPVLLHRAVISSSTMRPLKEFIREVNRIHGLTRYDVLLWRDVDIDQIAPQTAAGGNRKLDELLADNGFAEASCDWLVRQLRGTGVGRLQIPALATYFPQLTSFDPLRQARAIACVVNSLVIAHRLCVEGLMLSTFSRARGTDSAGRPRPFLRFGRSGT
jgi:hypothetical protein